MMLQVVGVGAQALQDLPEPSAQRRVLALDDLASRLRGLSDTPGRGGGGVLTSLQR